MSDDNSAMLNPLPWAVWLLVLAITGVELVLWAGAQGLVNWAGSAGWRTQAVTALGVTPNVQNWMLETRQTPPEHLARYIGFGLVHLGPLQAGIVVVITAALGKFCAEAIGSLRLLVILTLAQASGAVVFGMIAPLGAWLIGGYPLIFALAGCFAALTWADGADKRAQVMGAVLVSVLLAGRLALALIVGGGTDWIADIVACATGAALGLALRPGLIARLRRP